MRSIVYGPPGTGKTTFLLNKVEEILVTVPAKRVCFAAFTRRAAQEARHRALLRFNSLTPEDLLYFRTLHSLAFRALGLTQGDLMGPSDMIRFARAVGYGFSLKGHVDRDLIEGHTRGDRLLFVCGMARQRGLTLEEAHHRLGEHLQIEEVLQFDESYTNFKQAHGKIDFTDMIELFHDKWTRRMVRLDISHLFIDEAQDLSAMQWKMAHDLEQVARVVYIAGDDDQAIFTWAGADVNHFMKLSGTRIFLSKSYRCARAVHDLAHEIVRPIKRVKKTWVARDAEGSISRVPHVGDIDMSKGSWLVLARNQFLLDQAVAHCINEGWLFEAPDRESNDDLAAIKSWEQLRSGARITVNEARVVYSYISSSSGGIRRGFKGSMNECDDEMMVGMEQLTREYGLQTDAPWHTALDRLGIRITDYVLRAAKMGEDIGKVSRIRVSTIHAAKGAEADHVALFQDVAQLTHAAYDEDPDDEHRVWYVGVTRARESITFIDNESKHTFCGKIYNV